MPNCAEPGEAHQAATGPGQPWRAGRRDRAESSGPSLALAPGGAPPALTRNGIRKSTRPHGANRTGKPSFCAWSKKKRTVDALAKRLRVSRRTAYRDLEALEGTGLELVRRSAAEGVVYSVTAAAVVRWILPGR